jgi:hypothetical protein
MKANVWLPLAAMLSFLNVASAEGAAPKNIVLIAGVKSHGPEGNRIHDYPWSVRLLKTMLEKSEIGDRLNVRTYFNGWPNDAAALENADTIMIISDGRDGDKFREAPHLATPALGLLQRTDQDTQPRGVDEVEGFEVDQEEAFSQEEQARTSKKYEEMPKPAEVAIDEMMDDEIYFRNPSLDEEEGEGGL